MTEAAPTAPDIRITVRVRYLRERSRPERGVWTYRIRIENQSETSQQLLRREWRITDARGGVTEVQGDGVIGEQPIIAPGGAYEYESFVTLDAAPGQMQGAYIFRDAWGAEARVPIPAFGLALPGSERTLN